MDTRQFRAFAQAVELIGGQSEAARLLDVSRQAVNHHMRKRSKTIPVAWCAKLERATAGQVTKAQLRPDLWG